MANLAVSVTNVRFSYRAHLALDHFSHGWAPGVNAVLGRNGAGKTTLFRILAGIAKPQDGRLVFEDREVGRDISRSEYRTKIGLLPQSPSWLREVTVREMLVYFGRLRLGRSFRAGRVDELIEAVDLVESADRRLGSLSGGQERRAFLAQSIVHDPAVLILDEPTSGLDPVQRIRIRGLVSSIAADRTVLVSTHLVEDIAMIASDIVILDEGNEIWTGKPVELAELGQQFGDGRTKSASDHELGFLSVLTLSQPKSDAS